MKLVWGTLSGLALIVVALIIVSLVFTGADTGDHGPAETTEMVTYELAEAGIAIDLPAHWQISEEDTGGAQEANKMRTVLTVPTDPASPSSFPYRLQIGFGERQMPAPLLLLPVGLALKDATKKNADVKITVKPVARGLGPFSGAYGEARLERDVDGAAQRFEARIYMLQTGKGTVALFSSVSLDDAAEVALTERVLDSVREF